MCHAPSPAPLRRLAVVAGFVLTAIFAGACSSETTVVADDAPADTTAAPAPVAAEPAAAEPVAQEPTDGASTGADTPAPDCLALGQARARIQGAAGSLFFVEDAASFDLLTATDVLLADIETFRPYQDIEAVPFGPIRDSLDNLEHDLTAAGEGRFGDMIRDYGSAKISALVGTELCA